MFGAYIVLETGARTFITVSYTHLDVYKRQVRDIFPDKYGFIIVLANNDKARNGQAQRLFITGFYIIRIVF